MRERDKHRGTFVPPKVIYLGFISDPTHTFHDELDDAEYAPVDGFTAVQSAVPHNGLSDGNTLVMVARTAEHPLHPVGAAFSHAVPGVEHSRVAVRRDFVPPSIGVRLKVGWGHAQQVDVPALVYLQGVVCQFYVSIKLNGTHFTTHSTSV